MKQIIKCQMTMGDDGHNCTGEAIYWSCGRPAKAWIPDQFKRQGWKGRQYLCGLHARAHDKVAERTGRPKSTPLPR